MKPGCPEVQDLLSDFFDGRFPPADPVGEGIRSHLGSCRACSGVLADYRILRSAVSPLGESVPDPEAFFRRLGLRLAPAPALPIGRRLARLPLAAAAGLALLAGLSWWTRIGPPLPDAPLPSSPAPFSIPASWKPLGEAGPETLRDFVEAQDLSDLIEDLGAIRGSDRASIYRDIASVSDLARHGPDFQEVSYAP